MDDSWQERLTKAAQPVADATLCGALSLDAGNITGTLTITPEGWQQMWQPIETAPTDGTPVLLFARAKHAPASAPVIGWCVNGEWVECCFTPNHPVGIVPSRWMPLPDPPEHSSIA